MSGSTNVPQVTITNVVATPTTVTLNWAISAVSISITAVIAEIAALRSAVATAMKSFDVAKTAFVTAESALIAALTTTDTAFSAADMSFAQILTDVNSLTIAGESPNQTVVLAGSSSVITDASGTKWSLVSGQVAKNGVIDKTTAKVTQLSYFNHTVYETTVLGTWSWSGTAWVAAKKPF